MGFRGNSCVKAKDLSLAFFVVHVLRVTCVLYCYGVTVDGVSVVPPTTCRSYCYSSPYDVLVEGVVVVFWLFHEYGFYQYAHLSYVSSEFS